MSDSSSTPASPAPFRPPSRLFRCAGLLLGMAALVLGLWAAYALSPIRTPFDSRWSIHTSLSFARGDWGNLAVFQPILEQASYFAIDNTNGRLTTIFPIGASVLSVPAVAVAQWLNPSFFEQIRYSVPVNLEGLLASFYAALAGAAFFWAVWRRHGSLPTALFTGLIFCFASPLWSTASRALWQHGPQMLMFSLTLALVVEARTRPHLIAWTGFIMAWAYIIRPTSSLEVVGMTLYVAVYYRRWLPHYLGGAMVVAAPWITYNIVFYHNILPPYYWPQRLVSFRFYEALAGHLISPSRGLLVYSPVLLLAVPGLVMALRQQRDRALHLGMAAIIVAHWLVASRFRHWWGGFSYGPRLMSDIMPLIIWFIPFAIPLKDRFDGPWRKTALATVTVLLAVSVWMNARGAWSEDVYNWNETPIDIDHSPGRLWSWSDPPFLRGLFPADRHRLSHILSPQPDITQPLPYTLGQTISFGGTSSLLGRRRGWTGAEPWGTWTYGTDSAFVVRLDTPAAGDLVLTVRGRAYTPAEHPQQDVEVLVNGTPAARWIIRAGPLDREWSARIPAPLAAGREEIEIGFRIPSAVSPASLGLSPDPRPLGLGVTSLQLSPAP